MTLASARASTSRPAGARARGRCRPARASGEDHGRVPRGPAVHARGSAKRLDAVDASRCFRLGLFADAQYANRDDETRDDGSGRVKYFRAAEGRLRDAVAAFEREASSLSGVVNLGDLYDGYNEDDKTKRPVLRGVMSAATLERNRHDLGKVASILNASNLRFHHCLGNHDLSVSRDEFLRAVNAERGAYYSERLPRRWLLIVLDTTDLNPRYIAEDTPEYQSALDFATEAYASGREDIAPWSGGIGPIQLAWFDNELKRAKERGERVIVASHNALQANAARPQMSAWNADQVSKIIEDSGCVKICLAGHDHPGMYNYRHGVHYVTLEAMLEAKPAQKTSYAFLDVFEHEAVLTGVGAASSRRMRVSPLGVFTGIATFGAATIGELATSGTSGRAETSSLGLLDWINTYGRDYEG